LKRRDKHNKEVSVFAGWVKDSCTEIFLALLSCTPVRIYPFLTDVTSLENEHKIKKEKYGKSMGWNEGKWMLPSNQAEIIA
jgi:hypothetical protein